MLTRCRRPSALAAGAGFFAFDNPKARADVAGGRGPLVSQIARSVALCASTARRWRLLRRGDNLDDHQQLSGTGSRTRERNTVQT
jgi:hypothetical protein